MNSFAKVFCVMSSLLSILGYAGHAAGAEENIDGIILKPSSIRLGVERIKLPGNEPMGMLGTSFLIQITPNLYLGPAAYGAVSGHRGGFFTGGGELAWRQKLLSKMELETGVYVGGGGGGTSLVGGGLMVRPHLDLLWNFGGYRAGISASNVRFPNGAINSSQLGLVWAADSDFTYASPELIGQRIDAKGRTGVGFDRVLVTLGSYHPRSGSTNLNGVPNTNSIGYAGFRMEQFLSPTYYWGIEAAGAGTGGAAGYAEYLATAGAETPMWDNKLTLGARLALGMGGGGSISVGGGQLAKVGAYATANLGRDTHLTLEGGYAHAPNGTFRATYGQVIFGWDLDHPDVSEGQATVVRNEWVMGSERYSAAARRDGSKQSLDAINLKLNRYLTPNLYLTGQAHSAYDGNAGGYSVGLVGVGFRIKKFTWPVSVGAELLAGAAGGGGVDTSGGAIVQPMAYLGLDLTKSVGLRLSAGRVKSLKGDLNSNVLDLSASFSFGTTSH